MAAYTDRQTLGFWLGPSVATILASPPNMNVLIYGFRYVAHNTVAGTVVPGTVIAELRTQVITGGGPVVTGTLDIVALPVGGMARDVMGEYPIARIPAGNLLVGNIVAGVGSLEGVVHFAFIPGRLE